MCMHVMINNYSYDLFFLRRKKFTLIQSKIYRLLALGHKKETNRANYGKSLHLCQIVHTDMLDSLGSQLREAELRRTGIEKVYQETLAQIQNVSDGSKCDNELIENLKSKARELEKKVALETVRCEELQLELSAEMKTKTSKPCTTLPPTISTTSVTWASSINQDQNTEVELLMAKIEQDNRVLAELDESRSSAALLLPPISKGNTELTSLANTGPTIPLNTNPLATAGISICGGSISTNAVSVSSHLNHDVIQQLNKTSYSGVASVEKSLIGSTTTNVTSLSPNVYSLQNLPLVNQRGTIQLYNLQSTTMPILSLRNSHQTASSCLGLNGTSVNSYVHSNINSLIDTNSISGNGLTTATATTGSSIYGVSSGIPGLTSTYSPPLIDSAPTSFPFSSTIRNSKPKILDDGEYAIMRYANRSSPCSPIPTSWGFDDYGESLNVNLMHLQRCIGIGSSLEMETRGHILDGTAESQVDMLDIPGKGRCCVFIARFPYDPPEETEGELSLSSGDYLLVWTGVDPQSGYLDAELLDGRRGLVPASFVQRLVGDDLLEFHQAVLSTLRDAEDCSMQWDATAMPSLASNNPLLMLTQEDLTRLSESQTEVENESDIDDRVPAPKHLTLERQMNKSVLIGWFPGESISGVIIECYHVYVDGVLKVTVKATERTRALIEGVDSTRPHRISVCSVSQSRKTSRDAACTMIIGRETSHLGPSSVRAGNITCSSAVISWLPANSNHQHVICVNNVEVRVVKPGIYRHTITGLSPSTQYRVTVRAKHLRASGRIVPQNGRPTEEAPGAYADFRTLTKGLPDPPQDIQLEAGPQDGTILVTWQPVNRPSSAGPVTGYAVYADGKKVTDINSPTGDHALIDIGKLSSLNPKSVTIRTKSRDCQSTDSPPVSIPNVVRTAASKMAQVTVLPPGRGIGQAVHHVDNEDQSTQNNTLPQNEGGSSILGGLLGGLFSKNQCVNPNENGFHSNPLQKNTAALRPTATPNNQQSQGQQQQQQLFNPQQQSYNMQPGGNQSRFIPIPSVRAQHNSQHQQSQNMQQEQPHQKKPRYFIAMFDYDPSTMSPNPDGCDEELPFHEGDTIRVYGDKDGDGFYWGELHGRRGYVPHNMVTEVDETQTLLGSTITTAPVITSSITTTTQSMRNISRDRWGDIYANTPVKRMIALYDYDPQELSPNVDADQVELCFKTGEIILVYGDMDEDGFYMGELDGVRGLVPSNFLADAPEQFNNQAMPGGQNGGQRSVSNRTKGQGPGARGPPPPPRENILSGISSQRCNIRKDARPASPTLLDNTGHPAPDHPTQVTQETGGMIAGGNTSSSGQHQLSMQQQDYDTQHLNQQPQQPSVLQQSGGGIFLGASNLLSGATQAATGGLFGSKFKTDQTSAPNAPQQIHQQTQGFGTLFGGGNQQQLPITHQQQNQPQTSQGPGFISKLNEMTAPGSDILSKAKDSFFGKFGFGK